MKPSARRAVNISPVRILAATTSDNLQTSCFAFSKHLPVSLSGHKSLCPVLLLRRLFGGNRVQLQGCEKRAVTVTDAFGACLQILLVISGLQGGILSLAEVAKVARALALSAILQITLVIEREHTLQLKRRQVRLIT